MYKTIEIFDGIRNVTNENSYIYNNIVPYLNSVKSLKSKYMLRDSAYGTNNIAIPKSFTKLENNGDNINDTNLRIERAILTLKRQNMTEEEMRSNGGNIKNDYINDDYYNDVDLNTWREPRSGRSRREEGRGKKRGKNKRRPKRSHRRLGI